MASYKLFIALGLLLLPLHCDSAQAAPSDKPLTTNYNSLSRRQTTAMADVSSLNMQAQQLSARGQFAEAERIFLQAIARMDASKEAAYDLRARVLNNLGLLYMNRGMFDRAEQLYAAALDVAEKHLGGKDSILGIILDNTGQCYRLQKRYKEAEPFYKRALVAEEKTVGADSIDYAITLTNLALLHINNHQYDEAEPNLDRALSIIEKKAGKENNIYREVANYKEVLKNLKSKGQ